MPAALKAWLDLHDWVADALGVRGNFRDVRDVAAKSAEKVARTAALFHALEHGPSGTIGVDAIDNIVNRDEQVQHQTRIGRWSPDGPCSIMNYQDRS